MLAALHYSPSIWHLATLPFFTYKNNGWRDSAKDWRNSTNQRHHKTP